MIIIRLNRPEFEYDIHSLVKAFYPKQDVSVTAEEKIYEEPAVWEMQLSYLDRDSIRIVWWENEYAQAAECKEQRRTGSLSRGREFGVDFSHRAAVKNTLKQNLYEMLSAYTGESLPWGTLTGIRPTKIPVKLLEEGVDRDAIASYMKETYFASDEKIRLSIDYCGARAEGFCPKLITKTDTVCISASRFVRPLVCTVRLPPTRCPRGRSGWTISGRAGHEIDYVAVKFAGKHLNAVYIGGGTPTTFEPYQLDRLIRKIKCSFDLSDCLEFTVEAGRPDSITREKLLVLRRHGISRISINPQTMKDETLRLIGRRHTVEQTRESFLLARELGFDNINMDLILGIPEESMDRCPADDGEICELKPDNLTVHSLALKRAARLNMFKEDYKDYRMVNTQEHMELVASYAKEMGLSPYYLYRQKSMAGNLENVGYAAHGKAGVYNILIMEEKQTIVALELGHTTKGIF